jgi:hypothetical protein
MAGIDIVPLPVEKIPMKTIYSFIPQNSFSIACKHAYSVLRFIT